MKTILEIIVILFCVYAVWALLDAAAIAEEWDEHEDEFRIAYAICTPGDTVNIRSTPSTHGNQEGYLDCGDMVYLDFTKARNGFVHAVGLTTESGDGWIHSGYLVYSEPVQMNRTALIVSRGRLAARKNVGGKRTRWLKSGAELTVLVWSEEWCLTNCGYVMTEYLELLPEDE